MEWHFQRDHTLLLFPVSLPAVSLLILIYGPFVVALGLTLLLMSLVFLIYFYLLHIQKSLDSSVQRLKLHNQQFQILVSGQWLKVRLIESSLITSWLLALQWKTETNKNYYLLVGRRSIVDDEYRALMSLLSQNDS